MAHQERRKKGGRGRIWPQHKVEAVLESFKGEKSIAQICQERGIAQSTFFEWREQFLKGVEAYLANAVVSAGEREAREQVTPARSPDHNPFAEAFIGAFKEECVYQSHWTSHEQPIVQVEAWIEKYRRRREQAALGGVAPLEYRAAMLRQLAA